MQNESGMAPARLVALVQGLLLSSNGLGTLFGAAVLETGITSNGLGTLVGAAVLETGITSNGLGILVGAAVLETGDFVGSHEQRVQVSTGHFVLQGRHLN